ncbi:MAG: PilZ domain-containing protein [Candidatus Scalindua sp.]|nr:PilZ domain-containing protein [Candidatus Scalindua sp.]
MKISTYFHSNPEIEILEINGELTGRGAIQLEEFLYSSLDEGRFIKIINLKHTKKADGLGLNVLEHFINRGMCIKLFNVGLEIQNLLKISGKEDIIKLYNCREPNEAVLLFEKEILEEMNPFKTDVKRRCFGRVDTSLKTEFKGHVSGKGKITYRAVIVNLSVGGILIDQINPNINKKEESVTGPAMVGKELCNINFSLNAGARLIEASGECVWEVSVNSGQYAGVRFKNMQQTHIEMISEYVCKHRNV